MQSFADNFDNKITKLSNFIVKRIKTLVLCKNVYSICRVFKYLSCILYTGKNIIKKIKIKNVFKQLILDFSKKYQKFATIKYCL